MAGDFTGLGKFLFHLSKSPEYLKLTHLKRCFRVRGTHDIETRQQVLSASRLSCKKSVMQSSISVGSWGSDIVVCGKASAVKGPRAYIDFF